MAMEQTAELAARAVSGDAEAFGELYALVWRDLYKLALYTLRSPEEAEDAVQESALEAFRSVGALRDPGAFRAWMFRILTRRCKKRLRKTACGQADLSFEELEEQGIFLTATDDDAQERAALWETLGVLDGGQRLVVVLCVLGGYSSAEIAAMTGSTAGTVRSKLHRSLARLRAACADPSGGGETPEPAGEPGMTGRRG